nr:MAG: RNA-dependent RNA polymerase [Botourmiaviridae sp.]
MDIPRTSSCRVCTCVQRTVKSLRLATEVLRREGLVNETFGACGRSCEALREGWSEWTSKQLLKVSGEKSFRLSSAFKGTKTLFDEPCYPCDKENAKSAKEAWARRALFSPQVTDPEVIEDIKSRARWYMGNRWWREESVKKRAYVPDQQGCAEFERGCGGTLAVRRWCDDVKDHGFCDLVPREGDHTYCRIGTAKKKGKVRVVTMQSARAKRILRPVHEAAYDHLCRQPWLVRGDVTAEQMMSIREDSLEGETFNSGDFEASTDNLNKDAVLAVVEVLAEALPERRKKVLLDTFQSTWVEWKGEKREVVRGSMMGNLLSFVVLCLLNKIVLDQARQEVENCGPLYRRSLVNGDDLFFSGSDELFAAWLRCTKRVGFVINLKKTLRSSRFGDLNSTTFDFKKNRFVPRLNFGFLGTNLWKEPDGTVADCLFSLVSRVRFSTAAWLLNLRPVQSIFTRCRVALTLFPRRWWQFLVKKRWFRVAMSLDDDVKVVTAACGPSFERKLPFSLGPPLAVSTPAMEAEIQRLERKVARASVAEWRGRYCVPPKINVKAKPLPRVRRCENVFLRRGTPVWRRLWSTPVLAYLERNFSGYFQYENVDWVDDQPGLQVVIPLERKLTRTSFAPPDCILPLRSLLVKSGLNLPFART